MTRGTRAAFWFLGPALSVILLFFFVPVAASLLLSFTDFDIYAVADWHNLRLVGLDNYAQLLRDPLFWTALQNTFYFVLVGGPLSVGASLGAALLVNARLVRCKGFFRTAFFLPVVTTLVAIAVVWRYLYQPRYGLLNYGLGLLGIAPVDWLGDPRWAMPAIILMAVWKNFGFNMIIFIAGLQSIPDRLYEAAQLDGAGGPAAAAPRHPADAGADLRLRRRHHHDRLLPALRRALRDDPGRPVEQHPQRRPADVPAGLPLVEHGHAAAVAFVLFAVILVFTLLQLYLRPLGGDLEPAAATAGEKAGGRA